ncbi:MAG TPA: amino acid adenylation domain-containing protein, partial [Candidatus Deferrimicrobium sp.]|nr:amino acid adenylation domain-containing protein [Candidatus Deferrimicrobium sp.]
EMPRLDLPTDFARPAVQDFAGSTLEFQLGKEETAALKHLAQSEKVTLFMTLLAIYNIFLSRVSGREEIIVGSPVAGRRHADLERIIGMFVNTLALRNYPSMHKTFREFLSEIKQNTLEAFENQDYPFEELIEKLPIERNAGRNPVFDALFALQDVGTGELEIPGLKLKQHKMETTFAKFDLSFLAMEHDGRIVFTVEFCTGLFKHETAARFTGIFRALTASLILNPGQEIKDIEIMTAAEKKQILEIFNDTAVSYPLAKTIPQLFGEQVMQRPDGTAAIFADKIITYGELNTRAARLAGYLQAQGVTAETIVGIMSGRSLEMLTGLLGIMETGAAYLPIDPEYPQERIDYILKDSGTRILINKSEIRNSKSETNPNDQKINDQNKNQYFGTAFVLNFEHLNFEFVSNFDIRISNFISSNLAYVIYTSGSTGKPKGVMIEHRCVARLVKNTDYLEFEAGKRILQTGALEFDASTFEIWGALLNGLPLCLAAKDMILNPRELKALITKYHIAVIWMTAPLFNQMSDMDIDIFCGLENLLVGGDVLSTVHINRLRKRFPQLKIINGYGPTENTTFSTTFTITAEYQVNIPIGKPIANSTAYIVAGSGNLQPVGIAGELWVGGSGVARGYLNQPELTAEKFSPQDSLIHINKSFAGVKGELFQKRPLVIYKTGDRARWLDDGNIEFLGRIDGQVKIRGFRIELEEIENCLMKHHEIKEAVVTAGETQTGDKYLCAYLVMHTCSDFDFKTYLTKTLPAYMVPAYFVKLEKIPLTPNGKVDCKALPKPGIKTAETYSAPRDELEQKLVTIWSQVLEIGASAAGAVGIDDNFFQLGGHSLKATVLISNIRQELGVKITLSEIFRLPTIRELAGVIAAAVSGPLAGSGQVIQAVDK